VTVAAPLPEGATLAPGYEVTAHMRRGRHLDVYDAWSVERACPCVAKLPRPDRLGDRAVRRRLRDEGRLLVQLAHPNLVRAYEVVERPAPLVVLETLSGATLAYVVDDRGRRLPAADLAALGLQLCSALGYLHKHGVLHLDLKPSNIVAERGQAKLIDLSIARPPGRARRRVGTRVYMAPEQVRGGVLTAATDVWGLGAVLFEAAAARRPFAGEGFPQLERRADRVREHRRLPGPLGAAIDACLEPDPAGRPALHALADALAEFA